MGVPPERVTVVGNGVDTLRFHPPEAGTREQTEVLYVGRLGTRKGLSHLISAFSLLREGNKKARLRVVGQGPRRRALRAQIHGLGLEGSVQLEGHLPEGEVVAAYQRATCVVSPSLYEGLSTVLLEAMASGAPVVATAVPGSVDAIESGVNGQLVPPRDDRALAGAVRAIIESPATAARLGRAARETVERRYTWDKVTSRYESAFDAATG
jgi:glycosyltransferase involved in cell wall biosynthesis